MAKADQAMFNPNPDVLVSGSFQYAPRGTARPTSAAEVLGAAFKDAGYSGAEAWTLTEDASDTEIKIWGGMTGLVVREDYSATIAGTLLEFGNPDTLEALYGTENVDYDGAAGTLDLKGNPKILPSRVYVFDVFHEDRHARLVIPNGQLSRSGDIPLAHTGAISFGASIKCLPDEFGVPYYFYQEGLAVDAG